MLTRPGKGRYYLPPSTAFDSRHNLCPGTTLRRGAPGRGCLRPQGRRRGGGACGRRAAAGEGVRVLATSPRYRFHYRDSILLP